MARTSEVGKRAFMVAAAYAVVAGAYIFASSSLLGVEHLPPAIQAEWEIIKGLAFVLVTAVLLFVAMRQQMRRLQRVEQRQLATAAALMRAQQRASVALVAAAVAHEMKNVLMILDVSHQYVQSSAEPTAETAQAMSNITEAVGRLSDLTAELMQRARPSDERHETVFDLGDVARRGAQLAELFARERSCTIEVTAPSGLRVRANQREIEQAVLNLVLNALDAADERAGRVRIELERNGDRARLSVSDNGPGVAEELREEVFDAFFTTKGESGNGLGLAVVRDVARRHGGDARAVTVESGARFELELPIV
jgi:two-component system, NtrC family, sensor histidine kinase HydH